MDEAISHFAEKEQGGLLTIVGDPEVLESCMIVKGMYLYVFYCLFHVKDISTDMLEGQVLEERDPDLNEQKDIILDAIREEHYRGVSKEGEYKKNIHVLRWEVYVKEKQQLINIYILMYVSYKKRGKLFGLV